MYKPSFATAVRTTLATAALVTTTLTATAADLRPAPYGTPPAPPPPPLYSWSGCYVGGNIGGGWASKSVNDVAGFVTGVPGADLGSHTASGVIGGGQIGCDYQAGIWVFGVQGMFEGSGMEGSNPQPSGLLVNNTAISWLATVTGRVGLTAAPTVLVYAKGGGAWVRDEYSLTAGGATVANADTTASGWGPWATASSGSSGATGRHSPNTTTWTSARRA